VKLMLAFQHQTVVFHLLETYRTVQLLFWFVSQFYLFSQQNQQQTCAYLSGQLFINVVSLKQGVSYSDQYEIWTCEEKDKLVKENGFSSPVSYELEDKNQGDSPFKDENGNECECLIVIDMAHGPIEEGGGYHTQRRETEVDRHENNQLNVTEQVKA